MDAFFKKNKSHNTSDEFKDLIGKMLSYDPDKRPTMVDIYNHPWFAVKRDYNQI